MTQRIMKQSFIDAGLPGYDTITSSDIIKVGVMAIINFIIATLFWFLWFEPSSDVPFWLEIVGYVLQGLLIFAMAGAGLGKLLGKLGDQDFVVKIEYWTLPPLSRFLIGSIEIIGALLLLIGFFNDFLALVGGILLIATMTGALLTHVTLVRDTDYMPSATLLTMVAIMTLIKLSLIGFSFN